MNTKKHRLYALSLSMILLGATISVSPAAFAKKSASAPVPAPQINTAYANPNNQFTPGTDLTFTVEGSPNGKASVRVTGIRRVINLQEDDKGIYTADYTISNGDRITSSSILRATLSVRGRSTGFSAPIGSGTGSPAPVAQAAPVVATPPPARAPALAIQQFTVTPIAAIEPGADLKFMLNGTPGARANLNIDGVVKNVPMQEVRPGQYEASYTIRRLDHFPSSLNIIANLEASGQTTSQRLTQALVVDAKPPLIKNLSPRENETVTTNPVLISGTFDDGGGIAVDPKTVRILLAGSDVTANSTITPQFFTHRADLRQGTYQVDVSGKDVRGGSISRRWTFSVIQGTPLATALPLQILSPTSNAQVSNGAIEVRGRTAPDAQVDVEVQAIAQIAGFFGLNQRIYSQSVRADGSGNFAFTFQPPVPIPGARYEISMTATKGEQTKESKLVVFQQK